MPYKHITISEFKAEAKAEAVQIVRSPITQKLFAAVGKDRYKVQGTEAKRGELDVAKPISFMMEVSGTDDKPEPHTPKQFEDGCFVNSNEDNVLTTV